jgi:DNA-binding GntR family transcriptional regulator
VIYQFVPLPAAPSPLEKRLFREDVYAQLREWIVQGVLEPEEKLRDADLAARLGVSRTPVREALRRLEDEGLVQTKQNAWTRVAPVTRELAARIYPILRALESLAVELAAPHLKKTDLKRMKALNKDVKTALEVGDAKAAALFDSQLHECFIAACGNPELQAIIRNLKTNQIRLEIHYWSGGSLAQTSVLEHARLIEALERGDLKTARRELENNYVRALERWQLPERWEQQ